MKGLLLSLLSCFVFSGALLVSIPKVDPPSLSTDGIVVVEFNAATLHHHLSSRLSIR